MNASVTTLHPGDVACAERGERLATLLGSCVAYLLSFTLMNAWGATRASLVTYLMPVVGLLLGLFAAAPVTTSLRVGRMADRHGYHRPMRLVVALTVAGALLAAVLAVDAEARRLAEARITGGGVKELVA